jgi:transposase
MLQDRDGGLRLLAAATLRDTFPQLKKRFADAAYQGPRFRQGVAALRDTLEVEIVKRPAHIPGFTVLPKRWIVERTLAWLNRCRQLAKDWEKLNLKALAFLRLASIRVMLRKLCNPK